MLNEYCVIPGHNVKCRLQSVVQMSLNAYLFCHRRYSRIFEKKSSLSIINSSISATGVCFVLGISIYCSLVVVIGVPSGFSLSYVDLSLNFLLQPKHLNPYIPLLFIIVYSNILSSITRQAYSLLP